MMVNHHGLFYFVNSVLTFIKKLKTAISEKLFRYVLLFVIWLLQTGFW